MSALPESVLWAEEALCTLIMSTPEGLGVVRAKLAPEQFSDPQTRHIYAAALCADENSVPVNALSVIEQLEKAGNLLNAGGMPYVVELAHAPKASVSSNPGHFLQVVRNFADKRLLAGLGDRLASAAEDRSTTPKDVARLAIERLRPIAGEDRADGHLSADIPRRNWMDWAQLSEQRAPGFEWIWDGWLSWHPTLLAGRGGIGKSLFTQQLATALATNKDAVIRPNRSVRVLFWACEDDSDELWRRQERICAAMKMNLGDLEGLTIDARMGLENTLYTLEYGRPMWTPLLAELMQQVNDLGIDVLFLDNIGQVFGANENDRHHVTSFTNGIAGLVRGRPFCPVFLGHPAKATGSEYAGNAAWENAVRMRWLLSDRLPDATEEDQDEAETTMRYLCKRKANYSTKDILRMRIEEGVLRPAVAASETFTPDTGANDYLWEQRAERVVLEALDRITRMGIATSHTRGTAFLPKLILEMKLGEGLGKREIEQAMLRLLTGGQIKRDQIGTYSNRSPKFGLVRV